MSDTGQGLGWWQASDGKWYPPETHPAAPPPAAPLPTMPAPTVPPPTAPGTYPMPGAAAPAAPRSGMSGCAKALIIGGIVAAVSVVGVIVLLVVVVGRGVDEVSRKVVGVAGHPSVVARGEEGYRGMLQHDQVAGEIGTVRLAGYTTTATGWSRTTTAEGQAVICGNVTMRSPRKQGETNDVGDVLTVVGAQNWTLLTPRGVEVQVSSAASDFDTLRELPDERPDRRYRAGQGLLSRRRQVGPLRRHLATPPLQSPREGSGWCASSTFRGRNLTEGAFSFGFCQEMGRAHYGELLAHSGCFPWQIGAGKSVGRGREKS